MAPGRGSPRPQKVLPDKNVFIYPNTLGPTGEQETHFCCVKSPHFGVGSLTQHVIKGAAQGPRGEANRPPGGLALLRLPGPVAGGVMTALPGRPVRCTHAGFFPSSSRSVALRRAGRGRASPRRRTQLPSGSSRSAQPCRRPRQTKRVLDFTSVASFL